MLYVLKQTLILLYKGREMVISSPDIPLQEEIRYFSSKAYGGNTRKVFADHFCSYIVTYSTETVKWEWCTWVIDASFQDMFP